MMKLLLSILAAFSLFPCYADTVISIKKGDDASALIQKAIDELPATGGTLFLPAGRYVLKQMIHINRSNVTLRGETGTVLALADKVNQPNLLIGSDAQKPTAKEIIRNITISQIEFDGNMAAQSSELCTGKPWLRNNTIDIRGVEDLHISSVNAHHARSGGIVASWECARLWITDSSFHHNYFDGIALYASDGIIVSNFYCYANHSAGLSLDNKLKNVTFSQGHITQNQDCGIFARDCHSVRFSNLLIAKNGSHGVFFAHQIYPDGHPKAKQIVPGTGLHNCALIGCSINENAGYGIAFVSTPALSRGNTIIACSLIANHQSAFGPHTESILTEKSNVTYSEEPLLDKK